MSRTSWKFPLHTVFPRRTGLAVESPKAGLELHSQSLLLKYSRARRAGCGCVMLASRTVPRKGASFSGKCLRNAMPVTPPVYRWYLAGCMRGILPLGVLCGRASGSGRRLLRAGCPQDSPAWAGRRYMQEFFPSGRAALG